EKTGESALGRQVGLDRERGVPLVGEGDLADEADDQGSVVLFGFGKRGRGQGFRAISPDEQLWHKIAVLGELLENRLAKEAELRALAGGEPLGELPGRQSHGHHDADEDQRLVLYERQRDPYAQQYEPQQ